MCDATKAGRKRTKEWWLLCSYCAVSDNNKLTPRCLQGQLSNSDKRHTGWRLRQLKYWWLQLWGGKEKKRKKKNWLDITNNENLDCLKKQPYLLRKAFCCSNLASSESTKLWKGISVKNWKKNITRDIIPVLLRQGLDWDHGFSRGIFLLLSFLAGCPMSSWSGFWIREHVALQQPRLYFLTANISWPLSFFYDLFSAVVTECFFSGPSGLTLGEIQQIRMLNGG